MSRLIDADAFSAEMKKRQDACKKWMENSTDEVHLRACGAYPVFCETKLLLDQMPTIDAVEVVHGEWIEADDFDELIKGSVVCSNCGGQYQSLIIRNNEIEIRANKTPYCPNCGAKMDGERRTE